MTYVMNMSLSRVRCAVCFLACDVRCAVCGVRCAVCRVFSGVRCALCCVLSGVQCVCSRACGVLCALTCRCAGCVRVLPRTTRIGGSGVGGVARGVGETKASGGGGVSVRPCDLAGVVMGTGLRVEAFCKF